MEIKYDTVCTLGPSGTDSENIAKQIAKTVILKRSFEECIQYAILHNHNSLVSVGYKGCNQKYWESWVDLNFRYDSRIDIEEVFATKTKPMGIFRRIGEKLENSMLLHPSTLEFVRERYQGLQFEFRNSKSTVASEFNGGHYEYCLASLDLVEQSRNIEMLQVFEPKMIWVVYSRRHL